MVQQDLRAYSGIPSHLLGDYLKSKNEEAINCTRNRIYSLQFFHFLLYRRRYFLLISEFYSTRVSDDRKYVCGRRLYARINTRKFKGLDSREITSLLEIKKVLYIARHFKVVNTGFVLEFTAPCKLIRKMRYFTSLPLISP